MYGVCFTNRLLGIKSGIRRGMELITIEITDEEVKQYKEINEGTGYRALRIPAAVVNKCEIKTPFVYSNRGVYKEIG